MSLNVSATNAWVAYKMNEKVYCIESLPASERSNNRFTDPVPSFYFDAFEPTPKRPPLLEATSLSSANHLEVTEARKIQSTCKVTEICLSISRASLAFHAPHL